MANIKDQILVDVPYVSEEKCPACKGKIVFRAKVVIQDINLRPGTGTTFSQEFIADAKTKVIGWVADHGCTTKEN